MFSFINFHKKSFLSPFSRICFYISSFFFHICLMYLELILSMVLFYFFSVSLTCDIRTIYWLIAPFSLNCDTIFVIIKFLNICKSVSGVSILLQWFLSLSQYLKCYNKYISVGKLPLCCSVVFSYNYRMSLSLFWKPGWNRNYCIEAVYNFEMKMHLFDNWLFILSLYLFGSLMSFNTFL